MKVIWEPEDIRTGRRLKQGNGGREQYVLGYRQLNGNACSERHKQCFTVNSLADGAVIDIGTSADEACRILQDWLVPEELDSPALTVKNETTTTSKEN